MKWNRIDIKLGATIMMLFLIVLLPMGFVINQIFTGVYYKHTQEHIRQLSDRYAKAISDQAMTVEMIMMMADFSQVDTFVVNKEGQIIGSTGLQNIFPDYFVPDNDLTPLFEGKTVQKEYQDPSTGNRYMASGSPIFRDNKVIGGIFVLASIQGLQQSLQTVQWLLILSGIGAFFLALGFTFVLSKKLSNPLIQMQQATREIAKGNLDTRVEVHSGDEVGLLAQAINEMTKELKTYRDTRNEFFANVSHDLRTPITYIEGYANVLKNKLYRSEEEKEYYLDLISQESKRLSLLINDLFELSKMEEWKVSFDLEWVDITEVMDSVIHKSRIKASQKGLTISADYENGLPLIYSDGLRLEQIFMNLIDNAIRYTNEGFIKISITSKDHNVRIQIQDTGIGIPENEIPRIFERFYRVEKSRSREYGGTGLGLAIVKKLVELLGGNIQVQSEVGKGSTFVIDLPISSGGVDK
ncbi:sensor histidine kinase [Bacillus smithii]|uniref:sensor histidine kinase n=1 Tax=Bacillus smithii TaxID=1479 RepID=UPI003D1EBCC5